MFYQWTARENYSSFLSQEVGAALVLAESARRSDVGQVSTLLELLLCDLKQLTKTWQRVLEKSSMPITLISLIFKVKFPNLFLVVSR
jgi:hypothetical protein